MTKNISILRNLSCTEGERSWNILPPNLNATSQHIMKIKLFLLDTEQIHMSPHDFKKNILISHSKSVLHWEATILHTF